MKSGICLFWIAVGAIFTFAVRANTSIFKLDVAGFVVMVIGIIGLVIPRRGYEWLGWRVVARRTQHGGTTRLEDKSDRPTCCGTRERPTPRPTSRTGRAWSRTRGGPLAGTGPDPEEEMANQKASIDGADRYNDLPREPRQSVPGDTEVIEDVYEQPPA